MINARQIRKVLTVLAFSAGSVLFCASAIEAQGTYVPVDNWGQLPAGTRWGVMSAVGVDSRDNVYAFQRDDPDAKVIVFDSQGKLLRSWGEGIFPYAHGLHVLRDGFVWATDRKMQQVLKFSTNGELLFSLGQKNIAGDNTSTDSFNGASDVVMAANGDLFVSDGEGENSRVVKFTSNGTFIKFWGTKGAGPGQFNVPHCIAMDSRGRVWVGDRGNKRIQIFDQDGNYLAEMKQFGTPVSIAITANDIVYVATPTPENRVNMGTIDGKMLGSIDGLNSPHGVAVDSTGAVYVAESSGKAILKFVKK